MDGTLPSISPNQLYDQLGTASAPTLVDVRRDDAYVADDKLIIGAYHRSPHDVGRWASEVATDRSWRIVITALRSASASQHHFAPRGSKCLT
jgi:hypothetical protein